MFFQNAPVLLDKIPQPVSDNTIELQIRQRREIPKKERIWQIFPEPIRINPLENPAGPLIHAPSVSFQETNHMKHDLVRLFLEESQTLREFLIGKGGIREIPETFIFGSGLSGQIARGANHGPDDEFR